MALTTFPVFLTLEGKSVLVVGGGEAALRKARLAAKSAGRLRVVAPEVLAELAELAHEVARRDFTPSDLENVALAFVAVEDEAEAAAVAGAIRARGVPVNVPDRPHLSSFIMPAIVDRAPITVAISSAGASPVLARSLRARIEALLEPGLGRFAGFLDGFRGAVRATRGDETARRRFWEDVVGGPVARLFLAGDEAGARERMLRAVNEPARQVEGSVALVGAGPGDPDLLTLRALRVMQNADVVVYDKLVDEAVLDYVRRDARRVYVGKSRANHTLTQEQINDLLVAEARAGRRVVRLKGGDPFVFGRGGEELEACRAAGVAVEVVPGVTAAIGCGASTTIPLTHRGTAQGVTFVTGHGRDGDPDLDWEALARLDHTLVVYMGLAKADRIARELLAAGKPAATPVALVENGTRPEQRLAVGTLADLPGLAAAHGITGPTLIVIGEVVRLADPARIGEIAAPALAAAV